ncbi:MULTISPECIES: pentapeptide repeat-containing protein [Cyanophyceae]|uniref:pentapeptide repeat-containing protein n=1 Tax=Cyanophyceae TaxID=3028117 RepID=UPI001685976D|nr:pentapeptide repeat-containing protein [Trichocoleus sp. FACHB-69]MBD1935051.1 pentapeptide repeat-containing protein [Trichocoleus sp. FACHB-69]
MITIKQIWQWLNTDIRELGKPGDVAETGTEITKFALEFAVALGLFSATASPAGIAIAGLSGAKLAIQGVRLYRKKKRQELSLEEWVAIASPLAYLESFNELVQSNDLLQQINLQPANLEPASTTSPANIAQQQSVKLGEFQLDEHLARNVLTCFHESELAQVLNQVLSNQLQQAGINKYDAEVLTAWVAWKTHQHLKKALEDADDSVRQRAELYLAGRRQESEKYYSINTYLDEQIATKPLEPVFDETFTFKDIYVPLKVQPVNLKKGEIDKDAEPIELESWAKVMLADAQKQDKVMFIQGGPGRGKSVFCRMFADWARQHLHPVWTPILIRLRAIRTFEKSFEKTLQAAVGCNFSVKDDGWLTDRNTRFLFLLDGFDELVMERGTSQELKDFLWQIENFQGSCQRNSEKGHRVIITGRLLALQGIEGSIPPNMERVELLPMDDELQQQWFTKWETQIGGDKTLAFQQFLQDTRCPDRVRELAKEPLLLYLLAAMHRDGKLTVEMFEGASGVGAKILIYEQSLEWVLTEQRKKWLNRELTGQETAGLRRILAEAGLCVVQSGGECAEMQTIESRLTDDDSAMKLIRQARERHGEDALKNALAAFYLQPAAADKGGSVEFTHKSFGEFLCAERLKKSIEDWTQPGKKPQEFEISIDKMDWEIYDLFGYGGLTLEIVEYLMALLAASKEFQPVELFNRLEDFYLRWCDGEFIDAPPENLPQEKMRKMKGQTQDSKLIGQRQVDVYTGLNVTILLLELHRYAQLNDDLKDKIAFFPCGEKDTDSFDKYRLRRSIGYSECIGIRGFIETVWRFLSSANLSGANLSGADLCGADLCDANLSGADLWDASLSGADLCGADLCDAYLCNAEVCEANLRGADLRGADLSGAYLCDANLSDADLNGADLNGADLCGANLNGADLNGADLSGADLSGADLSDANLSDADLCGADLCGANLSDANLSDANLSDANLSRTNLSRANLENISWDKYTKWENIRNLATAKNVPEALKQQLGLS